MVRNYRFENLLSKERPAVPNAVPTVVPPAPPTNAVDPEPVAQPRRRRRKPPTALLAALAVAAIVALLPLIRAFDGIERWTQDLRFRLRGPIASHARVVIAAIDEKSEQAWSDEPMVFWTGHYGDMIRSAQTAGARVIAFDIIPQVSGQRYLETRTDDRRGGPDTDFADAIENADDRAEGAVIFAQQLFANGINGPYRLERPIEPAELFLRMAEVADSLGFVDFPNEPDGVVREDFRSAQAADGGDPLPSFATLIAERAERAANAKSPAQAASNADARSNDPLPSFYVDNTLTDLPQISAVDLATGKLTAAQRERLQKAVVLVGETAEDGGDYHTGPNGHAYSGVALQGQAVATLIDGRELRRESPLVEALATLLIGVSATLLTAFCVLGTKGGGTGRDVPLLAVLALFWALMAYVLFVKGHFLLPVAAPLFAFALPCLCFRAVHVATERLRRTQVEKQFGNYASPEIRDYLLEHPDLQPELHDISVLFLDIRGSTVYAERHAPEEVMRELNALFEAIDGVLQRHHGLLYRYTGDGFLSVFGAPKPSPTHAADAVRCAIDLLRETERFNRRRVIEGRERWSIGCSVNSGQAAAGKLGATDRAEYTVIGDVVNLAAKIESKNKKGDGTVFSDLVITGATLSRAPGVDQAEDLRLVQPPTDEAIGGRRELARLSFYRLAPYAGNNVNSVDTSDTSDNDSAPAHPAMAGASADA